VLEPTPAGRRPLFRPTRGGKSDFLRRFPCRRTHFEGAMENKSLRKLSIAHQQDSPRPLSFLSRRAQQRWDAALAIRRKPHAFGKARSPIVHKGSHPRSPRLGHCVLCPRAIAICREGTGGNAVRPHSHVPHWRLGISAAPPPRGPVSPVAASGSSPPLSRYHEAIPQPITSSGRQHAGFLGHAPSPLSVRTSQTPSTTPPPRPRTSPRRTPMTHSP
jgi:hypothetical protein